MSDEKIFCGNGKIIKTQYGEMVKMSYSEKDLKTMLANLKNGWVNTVLKEKKNKVEGKPTHYVEIDNFEATAKQSQSVSDVIDDTLPF
jgi:RNA binding exosome subunit